MDAEGYMEDHAGHGDYPYPTAATDPSFRRLVKPGRLVWAKVEGHDWWPAKVVRRRAVPFEVGPPAGGPAAAREFYPVVFFTARGLPGESEGSKPYDASSDDDSEDEAEYSW